MPRTVASTAYVVAGSSRSSVFHTPPSPEIEPSSAPTSPPPVTVTVLSRPWVAAIRSSVSTGTSRAPRSTLVRIPASSAAADSLPDADGEPSPPVPASGSADPASQALSRVADSSRAAAPVVERTARDGIGGSSGIGFGQP